MLPGLLVGRGVLGHSQCGFLPYLRFSETGPRNHSTRRPGLVLGDGTRAMGSRGVWGRGVQKKLSHQRWEAQPCPLPLGCHKGLEGLQSLVNGLQPLARLWEEEGERRRHLALPPLCPVLEGPLPAHLPLVTSND